MKPVKVVLVGSSGVGKSAFGGRFMYDQFIEIHDPTTQGQYRRSLIVDNQPVLLQVLDVVENSALHQTSMLDAHGFVFIYSITSKSSFDDLRQFRDEICRLKEVDVIPMILVGNKSDLENQREISADDGIALADAWQVPFLELSARLNVNVDEACCKLVREIRANFAVPNHNKANKGTFLSKCAIL